MIKITTKTGNLMHVKTGWLMHGCNSCGIQGSGVALAVKTMYPAAYKSYRQQYEDSGLGLGTNNIVQVSESLMIVNAITQSNFGNNGNRYVSYDAIVECLEKLNLEIKNNDNIKKELHLPFIGAGLGGGEWSIIKSIIESIVHYPVTVWSIDGRMPDGSSIEIIE